MKLIIELVIVGIIVMYVIGIYNKLVQARNRVKDQWAQIDVQLKRRFDLIPNLVETVKGYASHESETLEAVIAARNSFTAASTPEDEMKANSQLTNAISKLFALSEAYPELKANENFMSLQSELSETEDKIAMSRQFYNDTVNTYNNIVEMFPSNIIARIFNFKISTYYEIADTDRDNVQVKF